MGSRKKRLAALEESNKILEDERLLIDAEWAGIRATERQAAIDRARMLQHFEDPRVKTLHSQLLLSNVLFEREKQKEYKALQVVKQKIVEKQHVLNTRLGILDSMGSEDAGEAERVVKRYEFAADLRKEIEKRNAEKLKDKTVDFQYYRFLNTDIQREETEKLAQAWSKKKRVAKERRTTLAALIAEKQAKKKEEELFVANLEKENALFNDLKQYHARKKADYEANVALERQNLYETVSKIAIDLNTEAELKRNEFISKSVSDKYKDEDKRKSIEQAKREKRLIEQKEFQEAHKLRVAKKKEEEKLLVQQERAESLKLAGQYQREQTETEEKRKAVLIALRLCQEKQAEEAKINAKYASTSGKSTSKSIDKTQTSEYNDFSKYAESCIDEWKKNGRDIGPLIKTIEKEKPGFVNQKRGENRLNLNTFDRLGFTVRWVPSTTITTQQQFHAIERGEKWLMIYIKWIEPSILQLERIKTG